MLIRVINRISPIIFFIIGLIFSTALIVLFFRFLSTDTIFLLVDKNTVSMYQNLLILDETSLSDKYRQTYKNVENINVFKVDKSKKVQIITLIFSNKVEQLICEISLDIKNKKSFIFINKKDISSSNNYYFSRCFIKQLY